MRNLFFLSIAVLAVIAKPCLAGDIMVSGFLVSPSLSPVSKTAMATMMVMNHAPKADVLVSIETAVAGSAEIHKSVDENGIARMRPVDGLEIPPGAMLDLASLHMHIMLGGVKAPIRQGDHVMFTLKFKTAGTVTVEAVAGEMAHMNHNKKQ